MILQVVKQEENVILCKVAGQMFGVFTTHSSGTTRMKAGDIIFALGMLPDDDVKHILVNPVLAQLLPPLPHFPLYYSSTVAPPPTHIHFPLYMYLE